MSEKNEIDFLVLMKFILLNGDYYQLLGRPFFMKFGDLDLD
jgi:hypothetical protein